MRIMIRNKTDSNSRIAIIPKDNATILAVGPLINQTAMINPDGDLTCCLAPRADEAIPFISYLIEIGGE